jgi:aspartyl-tRNA(Asn)/glutamyl-tRNA(Gln) amidotransferase subunit A
MPEINSIFDAPIIDIAHALRRGSVSSRSLIEAAIARHEARGALLNAYRTFAPDLARARADEADRAFSAGRDRGLLQGLSVSVKDLFGVAGLPTYAGTPRRLPSQWEVEGGLVRVRARRVGHKQSLWIAVQSLGCEGATNQRRLQFGCRRQPA